VFEIRPERNDAPALAPNWASAKSSASVSLTPQPRFKASIEIGISMMTARLTANPEASSRSSDLS